MSKARARSGEASQKSRRPPTESPSAQRRPGRPEKYDREVHDRIILALRAGNFLKVAAASAGISESTLMRWMSSPRYRDLQRDVRRAQAEFEVLTVGLIGQRVAASPAVGLKLIARRYPGRWGASREVQPDPKGDGFPENESTLRAHREPSVFESLSSDWLRVIARMMIAAKKGESPVQFMERMEKGMDPGLREGDPPRKWYEPPEPDDPDTPAGNE